MCDHFQYFGATLSKVKHGSKACKHTPCICDPIAHPPPLSPPFPICPPLRTESWDIVDVGLYTTNWQKFFLYYCFCTSKKQM